MTTNGDARNHQPARDLASRIIEYETGDMEPEDVIDLFQDLVNTGLAWQLQGSYGRTAMRLLEAGVIDAPGEKESEQ